VRLGCLTVLGCIAGCQDTFVSSAGGRSTFSEVYSQFDPIAEFARLGCKVSEDAATGAISPAEMYGWKSRQGSLELPENIAGCEAIAAAIRSSLNQVPSVERVDDFPPSRDRQRGQPLHVVLRYVADGMRGHIYVWLFPNESETRINFAILLREERHSGSSSRTAASF
jgi:hypothetical protein